ncbi:chemotaxis response regulator protein-glutamate methylesterase [Clostridium puniceum]|uniref:protein-glutamate methylesterase n=1 Tax=Clostridium puniceum TaxID=29367 RepID=A0A1S8TWE0_9CLOT|nr:chemotaxis protein CheB [Clostridium puniceum]OOM82083.1 chemotaxis response regulator protein-glutamate methylesterase [Clostridium puniceum]
MYKVIVIGASAGGMEAIKTILMPFGEGFAASILIVQHLSTHSDGYMARYLNERCKINVKEADEKEKIVEGNAYIAPSNYHLLVEKDETLSLTVDPKVNYSRPAIDILFDSAAEVYRDELIGVILTGANSDGSKGLKKIKELGGLTIVQDPSTAEADFMPKAAIKITEVDYILSLNKISNKLIKLVENTNEK